MDDDRDFQEVLLKKVVPGKRRVLNVELVEDVKDWKKFFAPHVHQNFEGFATGSYGSGMHEFVFRKDSDGVVRMWHRKSSQATTWFPDGDGMPVFQSSPEGRPELKKAKPDQCELEAGQG